MPTKQTPQLPPSYQGLEPYKVTAEYRKPLPVESAKEGLTLMEVGIGILIFVGILGVFGGSFLDFKPDQSPQNIQINAD